MTYTQLAYLHLATVLPAFVIGAFQLLRRKGTPGHKLLGKIYMVLMLATGFITLAMPAEVGQRLDFIGFIVEFLIHFRVITENLERDFHSLISRVLMWSAVQSKR